MHYIVEAHSHDTQILTFSGLNALVRLRLSIKGSRGDTVKFSIAVPFFSVTSRNVLKKY